MILGDLNVSLRTPDQNGGAHFRRMLDAGWSRAPAGPTFHGPSGNPTTIDRSAGGGDDLANLTTLCAAHHQRGVHAGVIRITGRAPGGLVFETPLGRFRSGDRAA